MKVDNFELTEEYIKRLLAELKEDHIHTKEDLAKYLQGYKYMNDPTRACHLLISPTPKKKNFAFPYE